MSVPPDHFSQTITPVVILARPQMGENIGAAARAMKNCGLLSLRLVSPRDGWPNPAAEPMAAGAVDILHTAEVYDSLSEALHDVTFMVATSARPRDMEKPVYTPRQAVAELMKQKTTSQAQVGRSALLFGAERSGLDNDELMLADCVAQAPLNPGAMSLNLAQAVLLMAWEWRMAALADAGLISDEPEGLSAPADLKTRAYFLSRLEDVLERQGFFTSPEMAPVVKRNLTCLFTRGAPTQQELKTLHGILTLFERNTASASEQP